MMHTLGATVKAPPSPFQRHRQDSTGCELPLSRMENKRNISQKYKLLEIIGRGKFGTVHKGVNVDTKQLIAIKILNLDTDHEEVKDIQQEIQFLSKLKSVPNITHYYGSYLNGHKLWILMDYCAGGSVRTLLKPGPLHEKYISIIARELIIALQFIHENGVIHRDIKAANILISKEGKVKLCDFGVAAQLTSTALKRTTMAGTPYWMAPEVITEGATYNAKADIWSTGITIYEMATGNPPYSDKDALRAMQFITQHEPPRLEGRQYGPLLKEMIAICLEEKPALRPSAEDLLKSKFIKSCKTLPTSLLKEVIGKYLFWRDNKSNQVTEVSDIGVNEMVKNNNDNSTSNELNNKLTNHQMSSAVSIAETSLSLEEDENIKWDFDSLKSAEYIVENDINLHNVETSKFEDFAFETNNYNRDFTTSVYNRTFTIGNTMINNVMNDNKGNLTATATQLDSIINAPVEIPAKKEPPKSLLQLFQTDDNGEEHSHKKNTPTAAIDQNPLKINEMDGGNYDLSITIPPPLPAKDILPTPIQMRQKMASPLVPIEIPNIDLIENEIQEREKQRSRAATTNTMHLNNPKVESLISDQPLPIRKPNLPLNNRTPSPAKALESINTNLQPSPSKQTSPLHMKPLPVNMAQPLLTPLNGTHKMKPQINLNVISNHKNMLNAGPQTAPATNATNAEMLDSSIRARAQMRIQMPVPVSATSAMFSTTFNKDDSTHQKQNVNNANNTNQVTTENSEKNQFGFDVSVASSIPMAMTPVTERPHHIVVTPEKDSSKTERQNDSSLNYVGNMQSSSSLHSTSKLYQQNSVSNLNSQNSFISSEKKNGLEFGVKYQPQFQYQSQSQSRSHSQSHSNFETQQRNNSAGAIFDDNETADVTLTNENSSNSSNINNDNIVTGLGMMTVHNNGTISPGKSSVPTDVDYSASEYISKILNKSHLNINKVTKHDLSLFNSESGGHEFFIGEIDNLLSNIDDMLGVIISEMN